jgi:hypothetical protein
MSDTVCSVANKLLDLQQCGYCESAFLPESCPTFANEHFCKFAFMANLKMGSTNSVQKDMIANVAQSINSNLSGIDVSKISWSDFAVCTVNDWDNRGLSPFFDRSTLGLMGYSPSPIIGGNFLANEQKLSTYATKWVPLFMDYIFNPVLAAVIAIVVLVLTSIYSLREYHINKHIDNIKKSEYSDVTKAYLTDVAKTGKAIDIY